MAAQPSLNLNEQLRGEKQQTCFLFILPSNLVIVNLWHVSQVTYPVIFGDTPRSRLIIFCTLAPPLDLLGVFWEGAAHVQPLDLPENHVRMFLHDFWRFQKLCKCKTLSHDFQWVQKLRKSTPQSHVASAASKTHGKFSNGFQRLQT